MVGVRKEGLVVERFDGSKVGRSHGKKEGPMVKRLHASKEGRKEGLIVQK